MRLMKAEQRKRLKTTIKNLDTFREWFRTLPDESIFLNEYLVSPNGYCVTDFANPPCGTVGCVGGWLRVWETNNNIPYEQCRLGLRYLPEETEDVSNLFDVRLTKKPQKQEALERLKIHRRQLVKELNKLS